MDEPMHILNNSGVAGDVVIAEINVTTYNKINKITPIMATILCPFVYEL